jgi:hypothetical protein
MSYRLQFTLNWKKHILKGKGSYLSPWQQITTFALNVSEKLAERFPNDQFLQALEVFDPLTGWKNARDPHSYSGIIFSSHNYIR